VYRDHRRRAEHDVDPDVHEHLLVHHDEHDGSSTVRTAPEYS
jgi:hypothetical protein